MGNIADTLLAIAVVCMLTTTSFRSVRVWEKLLEGHPLSLQPFHIAIGGVWYLALILSQLFIGGIGFRVGVCLLAAANYSFFALCDAAQVRLVWRQGRFRFLFWGTVALFTLGLFLSSLSPPFVVLAYALLTYREQWRIVHFRNCEVAETLLSLHTEVCTIRATLHNKSLTNDVRDDNLEAAG